jgi:hypothetical protein
MTHEIGRGDGYIISRVFKRIEGAKMRKATRIIAASFGAFAGFGGLEHGYFEILQGNVRPESMMITSMGAPCVPEEVWHICEPAMTILPNFLMTGILSMLLGAVTMAWAAFFVQQPRGGAILALLCLGLLLFGGGIFPPLIGIVGGLIGMKINTPLKKQPGPIWNVLASAWPWTVILFFIWLFSQFVVGYFFNNFIMENGAVALPFLILGLMVLSTFSAYGYDLRHQSPANV